MKRSAKGSFFLRWTWTRDKFPIGFDLIVCRNVTIYFSNETKRTLSINFQNALKENGILFIGRHRNDA